VLHNDDVFVVTLSFAVCCRGLTTVIMRLYLPEMLRTYPVLLTLSRLLTVPISLLTF
jgi:hypothetical protein